jgi:hypothetical protein
MRPARPQSKGQAAGPGCLAEAAATHRARRTEKEEGGSLLSRPSVLWRYVPISLA